MVSEEIRINIISRPELQNIDTHLLESQVQAQSAARIIARHHSNSPSEEPRTSMISRLQLQQDTTATHILESQEQA